MPSGVKTPQLDVQAYQQMEAPPPPVPEMPTNNPLPTQAGYVSKAGAGAFIASNIINGYLKGRQHAAEVKQQKADKQIAGADYTYKTMADNYNQLLRSGKAETDPDVIKAKQAAQEAWQASLNVKAQYVLPQDDGKKKGAKQKTEGILKGVFGKEGIQPQVIPAAALAALKTSPPPGLGLSLEDKAAMTQQKAAEFDLQNAQVAAGRATEQFNWLKDAQQREQRYTQLGSKDPATLTLAEKQEFNAMNRLKSLEKDPLHGAQDFDLMQKIMGGAPLSAGERQTAVQRGLLQGPHIEQRTAANGNDELVATDPITGAILTRTNLGRHYKDNTQLSNAIALARFQQKEQLDMYKRAGMTDQQAAVAMAEENSRHPEAIQQFITDNPMQKSKDIEAVNAALKTVWGEYYDPTTTHSKDPAVARDHQLIMNFITTPNKNDATGTFAFKNEIYPSGQKLEHWHMFGPNEYSPTYLGNATPQDLQTQARALYNRTREALQKQGKGKYSEADLDRMLPPKYADLSGYGFKMNGPLEPPPSQAQGAPKAGGSYTVIDPTGARKSVTDLTPEWQQWLASPEAQQAGWKIQAE